MGIDGLVMVANITETRTLAVAGFAERPWPDLDPSVYDSPCPGLATSWWT